MKERIVFKTESSIKGRKEIAKINEYVNNFNFDCAFERKVEQVPENWEELKSLCKDIKDIQIVSNVIYLEPEDLVRIELYSDGVIVCNEYILAENRTVAQMWNFIKSLMEKEDVLL